MCSINHDLKAIFIHIPKCGGLFVEKVLEDLYNFKTFYFTHENHSNFIDVNEDINDHDNKNVRSDSVDKTHRKNVGFLNFTKQGLLRYYMSSKIHSEELNMNMEKWNQYTKFTFIRNPYDKIVSAWKYINKMYDKTTTFDQFLKTKDTCNTYTYLHAFITQYEHLLNIDNELKIDFIGKFEELNENLSNVLLTLNGKIKHGRVIKTNRKKNSSSDSINYIGYYTDDLIQIVNKLFETDFIKFGFKKCNNMDELIENSALYFVSDELFLSNNKVLLDKLILNDNLDISEKVEENELSDNDDNDDNDNDDKVGKKESNESEKMNKEVINTLLVNGLNINIGDQIESSCKNIIHENPPQHSPNLENNPMPQNLSTIHLEGIIEMFRRASELTQVKK